MVLQPPAQTRLAAAQARHEPHSPDHQFTSLCSIHQLEQSTLTPGEVVQSLQAPSGLQVVYLVHQFSILQVLHGLLKHREGFVEIDRQADACEVLADALLQDGPQAHALLVLLRWWQMIPPGRRWLHLPAHVLPMLHLSLLICYTSGKAFFWPFGFSTQTTSNVLLMSPLVAKVTFALESNHR